MRGIRLGSNEVSVDRTNVGQYLGDRTEAPLGISVDGTASFIGDE